MTHSATRRFTLLLLLIGFSGVVAGPVHAQAGIDPKWDHYRVYDATPNPATAPPVTLEDQFGVWSYSAPQLGLFANPDQKTHDGVVYPISNPQLHYTWWFLGQDAFSRPGIQVENQFGPQILDVQGFQQYLLNPATKNDAGPIPVANHYKCYDCFGTAPGVPVQLQDQFTTREAIVGRPTWLCNPTKKTLPDGTTYEIVDPMQHLVCYEIGPDIQSFTAVISDQFVANWDVILANNRYLCVPSLKFDPTQANESTWGRIKALYR